MKKQLQAIANTFFEQLKQRDYTADEVEIQFQADSVHVGFLTQRVGFWNSDEYSISHTHISLTFGGKIFVQVTLQERES